MYNLQFPPHPPPKRLNFLHRNIKVRLLGIHFGKTKVKLFNSPHDQKKKKTTKTKTYNHL
jgi:hypothetical protein